jgi:hypothetical protein
MAAKNKKRSAQSNINMVSPRTSTRTERLTSGRGRASNISQQESLYRPTRLNRRRGIDCGAAGWYRVKSLGTFARRLTGTVDVDAMHSVHDSLFRDSRAFPGRAKSRNFASAHPT